MTKNKENLCFSCALIFEAPNNESVACPECGFISERDFYDRVLEPARDAAVFGYFYRRAFERSAERGETKKRYALGVDDIFIFLALAIISGIVGNAAYNASWAALKRIISQVRERYEHWGELTQLKLFDNEEEVRRFIRYIVEFPHFLRELPPEIRTAIVEEMLVDAAADRLTPHLQGLSPEEFTEARDKAFSESMEEIVRRLRVTPEEMNHLWNNVPDVDADDTAA
jgi:hypothetical protein